MKPGKLPDRLAILSTNRLPVLDTKAGATPRIRGSAWMRMRRETMETGGYECVDCGRISTRHEVDHDIPLEQGGSNDTSNLKLRCVECHQAKTKAENSARHGH